RGELADDEPGLRTAEQLVARKRHQIGAVPYRLGDGRLVREAETRQIGERAGAEIVREQRLALMRQRGEVAGRHVGGEALDAIIRGVNLEYPARWRRHSPSHGCGWWCRPREGSRRRAP